MSHTPTQLELEASLPVPGAAELSGRFELHPNPNAASTTERQERMAKLRFGKDFSDHMAHMVWTKENGWHDRVIEAYGSLSLDPAGAVLHYGQEVFEGLKAYRHEDGSIWTFRPTYNAARLNYSSRRLAIPEMTHEDFLGSIVGLVQADHEWVPSAPGSSFYLRPFVFASDAFLGVSAASRYDYYVIASPSGAYFANGFAPINVWVEPTYHRAGPGGMGDAKTGGNYAASLLPKVVAHEQGYDEVLFLDAKSAMNLDELGGMNVFVLMSDGRVRTPALTGNILPGCTRSCIIQLLESEGVEVREETIPLAELIADFEAGRAVEMFACGTAAVVTAIGSLTGEDFHVDIPGHERTKEIYDLLTGIQLGKREDSYGWLYRLV